MGNVWLLFNSLNIYYYFMLGSSMVVHTLGRCGCTCFASAGGFRKGCGTRNSSSDIQTRKQLFLLWTGVQDVYTRDLGFKKYQTEPPTPLNLDRGIKNQLWVIVMETSATSNRHHNWSGHADWLSFGPVEHYLQLGLCL